MTGNAQPVRSASKRQWFYGFTGQVITASGGPPIAFYIRAGSEADVTGLRAIAVDLPDGSLPCTDNTYSDYALKEVFAEATGNQQITTRRKHSLCVRIRNESAADAKQQAFYALFKQQVVIT